ncbi:hypothetical protein CCR94_17795 [Rhodoblastus sphagnicola]|uniref:Uncharacterized protein n=1 Tax=Rhodoblastus sphagnicola TaxID=333368 RepID=A0A2S6N1C0_9HYPH|nr:hypothetical protein CCR94_17795 [Rhodoblastus sphagnicola]
MSFLALREANTSGEKNPLPVSSAWVVVSTYPNVTHAPLHQILHEGYSYHMDYMDYFSPV